MINLSSAFQTYSNFRTESASQAVNNMPSDANTSVLSKSQAVQLADNILKADGGQLRSTVSDMRLGYTEVLSLID